MGILKEKKFALIEELKKVQVPAVQCNQIRFFLRDAREAGELNLYEQYLLNAEALTFERQSYLLPAWGRKVGITPELEHRKSGYVERKRRPYQGNVVRIA